MNLEPRFPLDVLEICDAFSMFDLEGNATILPCQTVRTGRVVGLIRLNP